MLSTVTLLVLAVIGGSFASECPKITTQKPFDASKYVGLWYEIYRTTMIFQVGTKCVNATYTANADGSVGVWNQAIDGLGKYTSIRGTARVKDPSEPAALVVVFDNPAQTGNYNVLTTKYDEYALVYSCQKIPNMDTKFEMMWLLSRTKTMSPLVVAQLRKILFDIGADVSQLAPTPQNC